MIELLSLNLPAAMASNQNSVGAIRKDGFAILPNLFRTAEVDTLADRILHAPLERSRAGIRHAMRSLAVSEIANSKPLLDVAQSVLGDAALPFRATLFDKSPESNWLVVWHQDTALPLKERRDAPGWGPWSKKDGITYAHAPASALEQVIALRLHLNESSGKNGPLRVLPGSHTAGVLSDEAIHKLGSETLPVDCLVPLGGVLAMRPLLVHASSKSVSGAPRRVLHIEYASSLVLEDGLELAVA